MKVGLVGAGKFGTCLCWLMSQKGHQVLWQVRDELVRDSLDANRQHPKFFSDVSIPDSFETFREVTSVLEQAEILVLATPAASIGEILMEVDSTALQGIVSGVKGLDPQTGKTVSFMVQERLGDIPFGVLSGPNFAGEVLRGVPTASVFASQNDSLLQHGYDLFANRLFRVYQSRDVIGVEWGGVMKNVLAIVVGAHDGAGFGENSRAVAITRGIAELARLVESQGGQASTIYGLSGLGDVVLSCTSSQSRNYRLGFALGQGKSLKQALKEVGDTVEGLRTIPLVARLSQEQGIDLPFSQAAAAVLSGEISIQQAVERLLGRPLKGEIGINEI